MEKLIRTISSHPSATIPAVVLTGVVFLFFLTGVLELSPILPNLLLLIGCASLVFLFKPTTFLYLLLTLSLFQNILGYRFESLYVGTWRDLLTITILALMIVRYSVHRRGFTFRTPVTGFLLVFVGLIFIQIFNPTLPSIGMGIFGFRVYFIPILGMWIGLNFISSKDELKKIGFFLVVILALSSIVGIIQSKIGFSSYENMSQYIRSDIAHYYSGYSWYRVSSIFGSVWEFGNLMAFMILLLGPCYSTARKRRERILLFTVLLILFTGLISSAALSSIYCTFLGMFMYLALSKRRKTRVLIVAMLTVLLSAAFMEKVGWERVIFYFFSDYQHKSLWAPVPFHEALISNLKENFFGKGMGISLDAVGERFGLSTSLFKEMYPDRSMEGDYFMLMHQAGFPVMFLLMFIHLRVFFHAIRIRNRLCDPFLKALAFGIGLVTISMFVTSIFRSFTAQRPLDLFIWIMIGILFSLYRLENKELEPARKRKHPHSEPYRLAGRS